MITIRDFYQAFQWCLWLCFFTPFLALSHDTQYNELPEELVTQQDTLDTQTLLDKAWALRHENADSAMHFIQTAETIAYQTQDTTAIITAAIRKAVLLQQDQQADKALQLLNYAHTLATQQQDEIAMARALINIGQHHKTRGQLKEAVAALLQAIQLLEKTDQYNYIKVSYASLASIHIQREQYDLANEIYEKLWQEALKRQDFHGMYKAKYNLGVGHFQANNNQDAYQLLQEAIELSAKVNDPILDVLVLNAMGSVCFEQEQYKLAISYYEKALPMAVRYEMHIERASIINNLAAVFETQKQWHKAIRYYKKAAQLAISMDNRSNLAKMYYNLSGSYQQLNQLDSALVYYQQYSTLQESLFNEESNRQIVEMQTKYESAKKDESIALLKIAETEQRAAATQGRIWLIFALAITLILGIVLLVYLSKLRIQKTLTKKNEELYQQNTLRLVEENSSKVLEAQLAGETTERKRLASELHDRLGSQLATVKLYYDQLETIPENQGNHSLIQKANALLHQSCVDVRKIAHDLGSDTLHEFGLEAAVTDLAHTISASGQLRVKLQSIAMEERFSQTIELVGFRAIQELITNAIKHGNASEINIQLKGWDETLQISIQDNGKGFSREATPDNFGFGLRTIKERIENLKGTFAVTSTPDKGTNIQLRFHKSNTIL